MTTRFGENGSFSYKEPSQEDMRDDTIFYFELKEMGEICSIHCGYKGIKLSVCSANKIILTKNYYDILTKVDGEKKAGEEEEKEKRREERLIIKGGRRREESIGGGGEREEKRN
ncbi:predicted protein [Arabidopsis lyrata subsp. lyrata]|uniref:Predicted protein n=1 Tax=Arabidopsis lyrata subsp. lyrata TaxID=81972 RepID=D7LY04_ARALL|nr:predicted protein [Arabidopsis lyrata subsp. lyrata]